MPSGNSTVSANNPPLANATTFFIDGYSFPTNTA